jgi:hypothetical protein
MISGGFSELPVCPPSLFELWRDIFSQSEKMERAKRLELSEQNSEVIEIKSDVEVRGTRRTQIDTHCDAEFAEIAAAWPKLSPEIRAAVSTLIKAAMLKKSPGA